MPEENNKNNREGHPLPTENESKLYRFVKKHNTVITLVLVIIIILLWALIKMAGMQKRALSEKEGLIVEYETKLENLNISSMERTSKVLSWAVRGEMLRQNLDQVNQYFSSFVREPGISKIQLIDSESAIITLSTDKNEEGDVIENTLILQAERTYHLADDERIKIISPVMGLNAKLGILVIELSEQ